jgi:membrane-bound lytic murein transglycosylase D
MKRLLPILTALTIIIGCASHKISEKENNDPGVPEYSLSDASAVITTGTELDSLYFLVDSLISNQDILLSKIDSLENELTFFSSIPLIDKDFSIPNKYSFAGYEFNLENPRISEKFKKIFNAELRAANRYIPLTGLYFPYFEKVLKENGVPDDLKFLAVAESYLNPEATSFAKAAGIWQFMPKTGKEYGLKQTDYIDERRDVFKSTNAAVRLLKDNYSELKKIGVDDWLLAMCAYNAGIGNVTRDVKSQGANSFFNLIMRVEETDFYVYRALAIKMIMQYQKEIFGTQFELKISLEEAYRQETLVSKGYHEVKDWAKAQGSTVAEVYELNPWIKMSRHKRTKYSPLIKVIVPPGTFSVLLPAGCSPDEAMLDKANKTLLKQSSSPTDHYIVKKGDTLGRIAKNHGMSISQLKSINGLKSDRISIGQKLIVNRNYKAEEKDAVAEKSVPDSSKTTVQETSTVAADAVIHKVKKGETLSRIAKKYGTTIQKIKSVNSLTSDTLSIGQKLLISK